MLLEGCHRLAAMWQLYVVGDEGCIQQQILTRLIARADMVAISEVEGINLRKLAKESSRNYVP